MNMIFFFMNVKLFHYFPSSLFLSNSGLRQEKSNKEIKSLGHKEAGEKKYRQTTVTVVMGLASFLDFG